MKRVVAVSATVLALLAVLGSSPASARIKAQRVVGGLERAVAFTFDADRRLWYVDKNEGDIRIYNPEKRSDRLFFVVPRVFGAGELGLVGIALHPAYPDKPFVYAYATRRIDGDLKNQIVRIEDAHGSGRHLRVLSSSPAGSYHAGGRILFGPDGMLYAVVGEGGSPSRSQDLDSNQGKVLRMTPNGKAPDDNPFRHSRVYAYGIRNGFGLAFDPRSGDLWETENGPECNDELNRIRPGRNYGWGPSATCSTPPPAPRNTNRDGPSPVEPEWYTVTTIAPVGAAFCQDCGLGARSRGRLFFGAYNTGEIRRVSLTSDRRSIRGWDTVYRRSGVVLSVEAGPDGSLYFSTNKVIYKLVSA